MYWFCWGIQEIWSWCLIEIFQLRLTLISWCKLPGFDAKHIWDIFETYLTLFLALILLDYILQRLRWLHLKHFNKSHKLLRIFQIWLYPEMLGRPVLVIVCCIHTIIFHSLNTRKYISNIILHSTTLKCNQTLVVILKEKKYAISI